jgi:hypothetical protein
MFRIHHKQQEEESEKWGFKNMLQTSTAQLLLDMLAMKSNNIDPLVLLVIPAPPCLSCPHCSKSVHTCSNSKISVTLYYQGLLNFLGTFKDWLNWDENNILQCREIHTVLYVIYNSLNVYQSEKYLNSNSGEKWNINFISSPIFFMHLVVSWVTVYILVI